MDLKKVLKAEIVWEITLSFVVSFLVVLPQIWAKIITPQGHFFTGINTLVNFPDIAGVYFSAISNFGKNDILYYNPFTTTPQQPFFHYPLYLFLGKIVALFKIPVPAVYHATVFVLSFIFLLFVFKFLKIFFKSLGLRIVSFVLVVFGGLYFVTVPEGVGFFSLIQPNFVLAQIGLFSCLYLLLITAETGLNFGKFLTLFSSSLILFLIQPWMAIFLLPFCFFWGLFLFFSKKQAKGVFGAFLIFLLTSAPFLIYYGNQDRVPWSAYYFVTPTLLPFYLYGYLFLLAIVGIIRVFAEKMGIPQKFLVIWFLVQLISFYLPISIQRRLVEGFYFPVAVLSVFAIDWMVKLLRVGKFTPFVYANFLIFLSIGVIAHYLFLFLWLPGNQIFRPQDEAKAAQFLDQKANFSQGVLSSPQTGNFLPSRARIKVFVGHYGQTPNFSQKAQTSNFYYLAKMSSKEREEFLEREKICYVYLGPEEKKINRLDFEKENYLEKVFQSGAVSIYKTKWCETS